MNFHCLFLPAFGDGPLSESRSSSFRNRARREQRFSQQDDTLPGDIPAIVGSNKVSSASLVEELSEGKVSQIDAKKQIETLPPQQQDSKPAHKDIKDKSCEPAKMYEKEGEERRESEEKNWEMFINPQMFDAISEVDERASKDEPSSIAQQPVQPQIPQPQSQQPQLQRLSSQPQLPTQSTLNPQQQIPQGQQIPPQTIQQTQQPSSQRQQHIPQQTQPPLQGFRQSGAPRATVYGLEESQRPIAEPSKPAQQQGYYPPAGGVRGPPSGPMTEPFRPHQTAPSSAPTSQPSVQQQGRFDFSGGGPLRSPASAIPTPPSHTTPPGTLQEGSHGGMQQPTGAGGYYPAPRFTSPPNSTGMPPSQQSQPPQGMPQQNYRPLARQSSATSLSHPGPRPYPSPKTPPEGDPARRFAPSPASSATSPPSYQPGYPPNVHNPPQQQQISRQATLQPSSQQPGGMSGVPVQNRQPPLPASGNVPPSTAYPSMPPAGRVAIPPQAEVINLDDIDVQEPVPGSAVSVPASSLPPLAQQPFIRNLNQMQQPQSPSSQTQHQFEQHWRLAPNRRPPSRVTQFQPTSNMPVGRPMGIPRQSSFPPPGQSFAGTGGGQTGMPPYSPQQPQQRMSPPSSLNSYNPEQTQKPLISSVTGGDQTPNFPDHAQNNSYASLVPIAPQHQPQPLTQSQPQPQPQPQPQYQPQQGGGYPSQQHPSMQQQPPPYSPIPHQQSFVQHTNVHLHQNFNVNVEVPYRPKKRKGAPQTEAINSLLNMPPQKKQIPNPPTSADQQHPHQYHQQQQQPFDV